MNKELNKIIDIAMREDLNFKDVTTRSLINPKQVSQAYVISREPAIICGNSIVQEIFKKFDPRVQVFAYHKDGEAIIKNEPVIFIKGPTRAILSCERISLNFLARLSGIATLTRAYVNKAGKNVKILDTRKTTPGLRTLEKAAVTAGGGYNHRFNLNEMVMIKDNHRIAKATDCSLTQTINLARKKTRKIIEVEVDTLEQFKEALSAKPDIILLDNMKPSQIVKAVFLRNKANPRILLEASGGISLNNVHRYSKSGVDRISIGKLTHSVRSIDFSLEFIL